MPKKPFDMLSETLACLEIRVAGFEPTTYWTQTNRSTKLSYTLLIERV